MQLRWQIVDRNEWTDHRFARAVAKQQTKRDHRRVIQFRKGHSVQLDVIDSVQHNDISQMNDEKMDKYNTFTNSMQQQGGGNDERVYSTSRDRAQTRIIINT